MLVIPASAIGAFSAAVVGANRLAQTAPSTSENLFLQMGGVGLALGVGMYFIRRSDRRDDAREAVHARELEAERTAHEATRQLLLEALKAVADSKGYPGPYPPADPT